MMEDGVYIMNKKWPTADDLPVVVAQMIPGWNQIARAKVPLPFIREFSFPKQYMPEYGFLRFA